eukprot:gnl/MRDRNA2_/MRDRNA2_88841_c0_seq1.p1 gnl/MRDRNA2_/MRDRNA2_88841_c0~~gnl/MRDRNA2_/MRDRNA2_88841_c0_seq1.p1  ORF type:complete len:236 (-),score=29.54 gnl/MRDRNA2_/MRDRNA2_88841_c0_seq1:131-838(-)
MKQLRSILPSALVTFVVHGTSIVDASRLVRKLRAGTQFNREQLSKPDFKNIDPQCFGTKPALDRKPCGAGTVTECECKSLGCCWGGDDPFTSEITNSHWHGLPGCFYKYGGATEVVEQQWVVEINKEETIRIPGTKDTSNTYILIPATRICGKEPNSDAVTMGTPIYDGDGKVDKIKIPKLRITKEGVYKVCMNDSKAGKGKDNPMYFTNKVGEVTASKDAKDMIAAKSGCVDSR